jgi:FAD/FMN-containing dehydrogenase
MLDLNGFVAALGDIPSETDAATVRRKSRDMSLMFSPVMKRELSDRTADLIVQPRNKEELVRIAAAAARYRVPLLARGAGTCNFGQGIPLNGGAIVDTTALDRVIWIDGARVRVETGARLIDIDRETRPKGWELRMHSSTKRVATIGGFVAGGHAGVGSCVYGILRDRGNILGLEVVSVEETPKIVQLRRTDVNLVHHAYGANGLIAEVEMPLAPAWQWSEALVTFSDFMTAVRFSHVLATSDGIVKKLISILGWPLASLIQPLAPIVPQGHHMVLCMVAEPSLESFETVVADMGGSIAARSREGEGSYGFPIYEFSWGHTQLHVNMVDRSLNSVVGLYPPEDVLGSVERSYKRFRDVGPLHLEVKRFDGHLTVQGSPVFSLRDDSDLAAVVAGLEADGVRVANNHTFLVKEGGMKSIVDADIAFKRRMDPYNLLNPGKMNFGETDEPLASAGAAMQTSGWTYRDTG